MTTSMMSSSRGTRHGGQPFAAPSPPAPTSIVPPCCLVCRARIGAHHLLCPACWREVHFIRPPLCDVLGIPLPFDTGERTVSAGAVAHPPAYDRARAVAHFSGAMRTLVHQLKYADRHDARTLFGRWLAEAGRELLTGHRRHRAGAAEPAAAAAAPLQSGRRARRPSCRGRPACRWTPCC